MKSIRTRLVASYVTVIVITVSVLIGFLIFSVHRYYTQNVADILLKQSETSALFYSRYLSDGDLAGQSRDLLDGFSQNTAAQVQIVEAGGTLLQDSVAAANVGARIDAPDVRDALTGETGVWRGELADTGEPVLAVSQPLMTDGRVVGAVRFVTSTTGIRRIVGQFATALILAGLTVVVATVGLAAWLARTIIGPVRELTNTAVRMAEGDFTVKARKRIDDELGKLADTLNYMADEIQRAERLKNEFISSVSHELRTPLTSIKGWVITLRTGDSDNERELQEGLGIIEQESERLARLVEELLDFSKLEGGRLALRLEDVPAGEWLEAVAAQMRPRAARQGVAFRCELAERLPVIRADGSRLKQVLINVLDNAFKFTPPGGSVAVRAEQVGQELWIAVADTGCGISPEELPHVTRRFVKGTGAASGSGLGLAISEEIIRLHGGRLQVDSVRGQGTKVVVRLPL